MDMLPPADLSARDAEALFARIAGNIGKVMCGQHDSVRRLLAAFAAGGHVLLEDLPGTGKTTLAKALATSIGARFTRVQFTPDLLPSDILGVSVFNQKEQVFEFRAGPVFTSILLADEINRASPRTQSALLEVMAEQQVSVEGRTERMDELFFVIATQNPVEFRGTYPLPEAQMDRFAMCLTLGYVAPDDEVAVLAAQELGHPLASLGPVVTRDEALATRVAHVPSRPPRNPALQAGAARWPGHSSRRIKPKRFQRLRSKTDAAGTVTHGSRGGGIAISGTGWKPSNSGADEQGSSRQGGRLKPP